MRFGTVPNMFRTGGQNGACPKLSQTPYLTPENIPPLSFLRQNLPDSTGFDIVKGSNVHRHPYMYIYVHYSNHKGLNSVHHWIKAHSFEIRIYIILGGGEGRTPARGYRGPRVLYIYEASQFGSKMRAVGGEKKLKIFNLRFTFSHS